MIFGANDFVNRCVLSSHVADGFVVVFVQLEILLLLWQVKRWIMLLFLLSVYISSCYCSFLTQSKDCGHVIIEKN